MMEFQSPPPPEYFGQPRRSDMDRAAIKFRDAFLHVPARLSSSAASALLGINDLVFSGKCLGEPASNSPKYYHGPYILWLRANRDFLAQSERYARHFWAGRNAGGNRERDSGTPEWARFDPPKFPTFKDVVTTIDPAVGIGVVKEILGFQQHEIRILYQQGLLQPLGGNERYKHKRFFLPEILQRHGDAAWLHRAQAAIAAFWHRKNHPQGQQD